jgi:hypothetical protein
MITRPATIGTSSAHEVSAISAAIPNPPEFGHFLSA